MSERAMSNSKPFFARFSLPILMAFAFATPLLIQGAQKAVKSNTNKVQDWLPEDFNETTELRWFRQHFIADQFVLISWDGCTLGDNPDLPDAKPDDPRIERLAKFLVPHPEVKPVRGEPAGYQGMFQAVTTARRLLNDLTSKPSEIPYAEAHKRLENVLIGPDGKQTCIIVMLSDAAIKDFRGVLARSVIDGKLPWRRKPGILWEAFQQCGVPAESVHLGGPPVENVAIDEEGGRTIARLGAISGLLGLGLAWWSLRSIRLTAIVFACGILAAASGLAAVYWSGHTMDAVLMSMPSLLYVLAISGAVHLVSYYRESVKDHLTLEGAPDNAIRMGWKPALLCSVTTAIGLGSLYVSDIEPIAKFGIFSAIGVLLMLVTLFLFLPAALQMWPSRSWIPKPDAKLSHDERHDPHAGTIWSDQVWSNVSDFLVRHHVAVSIGCFLVIAVVGYGVTMMHTSIDLLKLFDSEARVRTDYAWLEKNVARLVPMEVVVRFPKDTIRDEEINVDIGQIPKTQSLLERMEMVSWIQQIINKQLGPEGRDLVGPPMAAATFAPPLPEGRDVFAVGRRTTTNAQLEASHKNLAKSGYLAIDDGAELWRVSLRAAAFRDLDYGEFVESVRAVVEPVLAAQRLRQFVLARLVADHPGESFAGDSVCIWDPRGIQSADAAADHAAAGPVDTTIDSQKIFVDSWKQFLANARLKLQYASYDLAELDQAQRDKLLAALQKFDLVVLSGPFTDAQVQALSQAGIRLADARQLSMGDTGFEAKNRQPSADTVSAVYTGVVPIVYKAQRALLDNLMQSTFWSFITITPLLMLVSRSIAGGAVAMMPNVLPVLVIFGSMGWLGINIDIGSMMSASIALGVAVDDTIHFLTWYRRDLNELRDRRAAIRKAYRHCAPPTIQAALISGLSLSVFVLSTFTPTQRMGWLMLSILLAGMVAELVMLPALLAGPLGRAFPIRPQKPGPHDGHEPPRGDGITPQQAELPPTRVEPARATSGIGDAELSAGRLQPHAFTLRDRLAAIRRGARDAGK